MCFGIKNLSVCQYITILLYQIDLLWPQLQVDYIDFSIKQVLWY